VLADVNEHPGRRRAEVIKRLKRPRSTVDRVLQELHLLHLVEVDDTGDGTGWR
jgi:DNA-binding IclR family transcriptional regulator